MEDPWPPDASKTPFREVARLLDCPSGDRVGERTALPDIMPILRRGTPSAERIDRLGWTVGTGMETYGVRVGIRLNDAHLLPRLVPHLPPSWRPARAAVVDRLFSLWVDPGRGERGRRARLYAEQSRLASASLERALALLESEIRQAVAAAARRWVFVHAGVVGWQGRAIVIPGRSRSGKTTLVAALVQAGAEYYSDEFAVLDRRGRVSPFPKPLSIRGPGGCDLHVRHRTAEELGGVRGQRPLKVGLVVLTGHRPGGRWRPERLSPGRAVVEMLAHTVPARLRPEASLEALERAVENALVLRGARGEAGDIARRLLERLDHPSGRAGRQAPAASGRSAKTRPSPGRPGAPAVGAPDDAALLRSPGARRRGGRRASGVQAKRTRPR